jgi:hypothetical protein
MNYQPPKALQAQSKNRAIKPAIQNTFKKSVMKSVSPNLLIFGVNLFPVFLSNERFVFRTRVLLRNRIYMKYFEYLTCIFRHDMEEKLMLEVNAANSKIVEETQEEMKAVEKFMSDIQNISYKFYFVTKHGSEKQIFRYNTITSVLCQLHSNK